MRRILLIILIPFVLSAQDVDSLQSARLSVLSTPEGAEVMVDSAQAGVTPLRGMRLMGGTHDLRVAYPSFRDWNASVHQQTLRLTTGEEITTSVEFGSVMSIHTIPSGAEVVYGGKILGTTPLYYRSPVTLRSALLLKKDRYEEKMIDPTEGSMVVPLKLRGDSLPPSDVVVQSASEPAQPRWATYTAAAGVVVSGVAAAYFKNEADKRFGLYASGSNASDLDATQRLDAYSAAAFVATQISFAVLTYLLLSE
ncbi:MAG TPA: PEGA domain-containing protein [Bacteroidota bacterium]